MFIIRIKVISTLFLNIFLKTEYSNRYSKSEIDEEGGGEIVMNTITIKSNNKEEKKNIFILIRQIFACFYTKLKKMIKMHL